MYFFMRFPQGRSKAVTLSYDDGKSQDIRLIAIMKKHGLKGTFNLNSGNILKGETMREQVRELYIGNGMEVAVHGLTHSFLDQLPPALCTGEILQDRINLEEEFDTIIRGMAYPYGTCDDSVVASVKQCGIVYARTTAATERFNIPDDWLRLPATCHHNHPKLMELARQFAEYREDREPQLFYLWGHSYEFDQNDNWNVIEEFGEYIGHRETIWYATNIEIYDYITAYRQLIFSADGRKVYNPTHTVLYFETMEGTYCVRPGETIFVN